MAIYWRGDGEPMGTIDLRELRGDEVVIHFGGALTSVDAYTFANSLVSFADAARLINEDVAPGENIEVRVQAIGEGSFRALLKRVPKGLSKLFSRGADAIVWGVLATIIYEKALKEDPATTITVNSQEVIIQRGGDKIIVSKDTFDRAAKLKKNPEVQKSIAKTFDAVSRDEAITNFGLTPKMSDKSPLVQISRSEFDVLASPSSYALEAPSSGARKREERCILVILKLWFKAGTRKWSFEWNGVPISARITDADFFSKIDRREILIGSGDALEVILEFEQEYDESIGMHVNNPNTYTVTRVIRHIQRGAQGRLFDDDAP